jgi:hypothetical protein
VNPSNTLEENAAIFEDIMTNKVKRISNNIIRSGKDLVMTADVAKNKRLDRIQGHGFYLSESFVSTEGDSEPMGRRFSSSASASGANVLNRSMYGDVSESSEADANVLNHSTYDDARESSEAFDGEEYVPDCENEDGNEEYRGDEELPIPVNFWENMVIDWELAAKDRNDVEYFEKDDKSLPRHWANMINDWEEELRTNGSATTTAFNNMDAFSNSTNVTSVHPGIFSTPIRTATRLSPKKMTSSKSGSKKGVGKSSTFLRKVSLKNAASKKRKRKKNLMSTMTNNEGRVEIENGEDCDGPFERSDLPSAISGRSGEEWDELEFRNCRSGERRAGRDSDSEECVDEIDTSQFERDPSAEVNSVSSENVNSDETAHASDVPENIFEDRTRLVLDDVVKSSGLDIRTLLNDSSRSVSVCNSEFSEASRSSQQEVMIRRSYRRDENWKSPKKMRLRVR